MITSKDLIGFDEALFAVAAIRDIVFKQYGEDVQPEVFQPEGGGPSMFDNYAFIALLGAPRVRLDEYLEALSDCAGDVVCELVTNGHALAADYINMMEGRA